jgi:Co/Zn/Cd efflux system component
MKHTTSVTVDPILLHAAKMRGLNRSLLFENALRAALSSDMQPDIEYEQVCKELEESQKRGKVLQDSITDLAARKAACEAKIQLAHKDDNKRATALYKSVINSGFMEDLGQ